MRDLAPATVYDLARSALPPESVPADGRPGIR
jgi:hypothetical protein